MRVFAVSILAWLLATVAPAPGGAAPLTREAEQGQALFGEKCVACHTIGQGDRVGPDLAGVTSRRSHAWLGAWISAPDRVLAQGDPIARELFQKYRGVPMPNQGLAVDQVATIVAFLASESGAGGTATAGAPARLPAGSPALGRELFTGTRRLQNGGPPCMACHSIGGIGALGGGALGPDLTLAAARFGDAGLASALANLPFPTMSPIFAARPLTPEEQGHLRVFVMQAAVTGRSPEALGRLTGFAVGGALVLFGLAHVSWRHRLTGVRRRMVEAQRGSPRRGSSPIADPRTSTSRRP